MHAERFAKCFGGKAFSNLTWAEGKDVGGARCIIT